MTSAIILLIFAVPLVALAIVGLTTGYALRRLDASAPINMRSDLTDARSADLLERDVARAAAVRKSLARLETEAEMHVTAIKGIEEDVDRLRNRASETVGDLASTATELLHQLRSLIGLRLREIEESENTRRGRRN